jgi:biotin carboxyl carrier protein
VVPLKYHVDVCGRTVEIELAHKAGKIWAIVSGKQVTVELHRHSQSGVYTLAYGDRRTIVAITREGGGRSVIQWQGQAYPVQLERSVVRSLRQHLRKPTEESNKEEIVRAHMPGLIVKVAVREGETVERGAGLLILAAMKMENEIRAPSSGVIAQVAVEAGREVSRGQVLCVIHPNHVR